jgi:hypothetical protein
VDNHACAASNANRPGGGCPQALNCRAQGARGGEELKRSFATQLHDEVQRRARRLLRRSRRSPLVSLAEAPPEALCNDDPDGVGREDRPDGVDALQLVHKIRELVRGDSPVLQLLDLYERGLFRRRDARQLGMSVPAYRAARASGSPPTRRQPWRPPRRL